MDNLLVCYMYLLRLNGLAWLTKSNARVAIHHLLTATEPKELRKCIELELKFANWDLKKDLSRFKKEAVELAEAFQLVENIPQRGKSRYSRSSVDDISSKNVVQKNNHSRNHEAKSDKNGNGKIGILPPLCLHKPCRKKLVSNLVLEFSEWTDEERKALLKQIASERAKDGP